MFEVTLADGEGRFSMRIAGGWFNGKFDDVL
jgi:hypothetical protein